jgi:hypothetical protein
MTRTYRSRTVGELETGGNPLSNPYATFPIEEPTEEENEAEAKRRAVKLMDEFIRGIDRSAKSKNEIIDAMTANGPFIAFINLYKVAMRCDLTSTSEEYYKAVERLKRSFDEKLESEMLFDVENE